MKICPPAEPVSIAEPSIRLTMINTHLTREQLECLSRCARGISVRFEHWEIVDALIVGGYAEKGVAGTVTVTAKGQQYLRTHAT
jgi:predicted metal-binding protein